jgi:hypothetical protein
MQSYDDRGDLKRTELLENLSKAYQGENVVPFEKIQQNAEKIEMKDNESKIVIGRMPEVGTEITINGLVFVIRRINGAEAEFTASIKRPG